MRQNSWRWLVFTASILVFVGIGALWSCLERIEDAGHWRIGFSLVEWAAMFGAVFAFPNLERKKAVYLLGLAAILVRLSFWNAPVSNDVNRYVWEGHLLWEGHSPYATEASDESLAHLRDEFWEGMNTRERMTAYPPGMELVMAGASRLWYHLHIFKLIALIGDLWILALLVILSREFVRPVRWLGLYAFNPIVLSSFAVEAHFDSLMVAPMLTALLMASRERWKGAWFWLGFAVQMKIMAVILAPLLLVGGNRRAIQQWLKRPFQEFGSCGMQVLRQMWPFLLMLILPSLFFWRYLGNMLYGLLAFGSQGAFNGGLFDVLIMLGVPNIPTRLLGTAVFLGSIFVFLRALLHEKEKDYFKMGFWIFLVLLVFSPVVHFWYLTWVVWYLVIRPIPSLLVLCGTSSVYFLTWIFSELGWGWGYPREFVVASWLPFFALFLWEIRYWRSRGRRKNYPEAESMSAVVPVYQEGPGLKDFLKKLEDASSGLQEIVVVDGAGDLKGEEDWGSLVRVIESERGRGRQIAKGIKETTGDLVTIIHADTQPRQGWVSEVYRAAKKTPRASAFALGQRFEKVSLGLLVIECLNEMRVAFGGTVFGDQTMIIRRQALEEVGGFPEQPLMEDVEVSNRLRLKGEIVYLGGEWLVSAQKWQRGFWDRFKQIIGLMIRYGFTRVRGKRHAENLSNQLFEEYYPDDSGEEDE